MEQATLFIVSAPSGAGKTSLVKALLEKTQDIAVSVSHTTRPQRPGEQDNVNYHFVDNAQFKQMVADDAFLESATVFEHYYGTSKSWVKQQLSKGIDVLLEIDWQGAEQVRQHCPNAVTIFILPPTLATLRQRLCHRGQDAASVIDARVAGAQAEMQHYQAFDYIIINDDFDTALADLQSIIMASRLQQSLQCKKNGQLLNDLLT